MLKGMVCAGLLALGVPAVCVADDARSDAILWSAPDGEKNLVLAALANIPSTHLEVVLEVQAQLHDHGQTEVKEVVVPLNDAPRIVEVGEDVYLCLRADGDPDSRILTVQFSASHVESPRVETLVLASPRDRPGTHRQSASGVLMRLVQVRAVEQADALMPVAQDCGFDLVQPARRAHLQR